MKLEADWSRTKPPLIERYREFLPVSSEMASSQDILFHLPEPRGPVLFIG